MAQSSTATPASWRASTPGSRPACRRSQQYLSSTSFNNFTLQAATPSAERHLDRAQCRSATDTYKTQQLVTNANLNNPVPGLSASDSFTIAREQGRRHHQCADRSFAGAGPADLGQHRQLHQFASFPPTASPPASRKPRHGGTADLRHRRHLRPADHARRQRERFRFRPHPRPRSIWWAIPARPPKWTPPSARAPTPRSPPRPPIRAAASPRLANLSAARPPASCSANQQATTGTTTAQATVVDSSGNVYVLGNATGNFGNQINQGTPGRLSHQI